MRTGSYLNTIQPVLWWHWCHEQILVLCDWKQCVDASYSDAYCQSTRLLTLLLICCIFLLQVSDTRQGTNNSEQTLFRYASNFLDASAQFIHVGQLMWKKKNIYWYYCVWDPEGFINLFYRRGVLSVYFTMMKKKRVFCKVWRTLWVFGSPFHQFHKIHIDISSASFTVELVSSLQLTWCTGCKRYIHNRVAGLPTWAPPDGTNVNR